LGDDTAFLFGSPIQSGLTIFVLDIHLFNRERMDTEKGIQSIDISTPDNLKELFGACHGDKWMLTDLGNLSNIFVQRFAPKYLPNHTVPISFIYLILLHLSTNCNCFSKIES